VTIVGAAADNACTRQMLAQRPTLSNTCQGCDLVLDFDDEITRSAAITGGG
jgi:hypothetical protein